MRLDRNSKLPERSTMSIFTKIFTKLFRRRITPLERDLHAVYVQSLLASSTMSRDEAEKIVADALSACRQQSKEEGTDRLPENYGDILIVTSESGQPDSRDIVQAARGEGATDDDIREWWNLPDLCRRMVIWSETYYRSRARWLVQDEHGLSPVAAEQHIRQKYPIYGKKESDVPGQDNNRPLPHELRGRIDAHERTVGAARVASRAKGFSSYNAYVRDAIRNGLL